VIGARGTFTPKGGTQSQKEKKNNKGKIERYQKGEGVPKESSEKEETILTRISSNPKKGKRVTDCLGEKRNGGMGRHRGHRKKGVLFPTRKKILLREKARSILRRRKKKRGQGKWKRGGLGETQKDFF